MVKQKLIRSDLDLFIGENPVIVICPFIDQNTRGSILDKCAMVMFPISPNEVVVLYRPNDCEVKDDYVFTKNEAICFNSFQIQQTGRFIAYRNDFEKEKSEYEFYYKNIHDHRTKTLPNGIKILHTWQDLHFPGLDSCFRNIFFQV